jgi:hypothetical protein
MDRYPDYAAIFPRTPARNAMMRTEETLTPASASTSELVSHRNPDGLILSTGNLYFTYHDAATASVWKAVQSALPGREIVLYSEPGPALATSSSHRSTARSGDTSSRPTEERPPRSSASL